MLIPILVINRLSELRKIENVPNEICHIILSHTEKLGNFQILNLNCYESKFSP